MILSTILAVVFWLFPLQVVAETPTETPLEAPISPVEQRKPVDLIQHYADKYNVPSDLPRAIIHCESRTNQAAIGRAAVVGVDVGLWQINTYYHEATAARMGMDIWTAEGNLDYGFYLYTQQGSRPWSASRPCWYN
jgi:soluble lytic murein transglycosylase-like protein